MKKIITNIFALTLLFALAGCAEAPGGSNSKRSKGTSEESSTQESSSESSSSSNSSSEDDLDDGREIRENKLYTDSGLSIEFSETGAAISKISWDNTQIAKDGFVVGRCANRIANAEFSLNGQTYTLDKNDNNKHSLHGGSGSGFNSWRGPFATATWTKEPQTNASSITFKIHSNDGDHGYPGIMDMTVKYTLKQSGELLIEYSAENSSTVDTLWNPTNHLYMNLNGSNNRNYNNVNLMIDADSYTPIDNEKIPDGTTASVEGTKFDYRTETAFRSNEEYDDNYVLNGTGYRKVASMSGTTGGYKVEVFTDRPGLQLYKAGNGDICLESQMMPDAINQKDFENPILKAGETLTTKTAYVFSKLA